MPTKFSLLAIPQDWSYVGKQTGGGLLKSSFHAVPINRTNVVVTGVNVSNWKQLIARGQSATTTMDGIRWGFRRLIGQEMTIRQPPGPFVTEFLNITGTSVAIFTNLAIPTTSSVIDTQADDKARSKLLSHYLDATRKFNGSSFVAEARETIEMFKKPLKHVFMETDKLAKDFRKLVSAYHKVSWRPNQVAGLRKRLASYWLEWSFGIKPFVADMNDAAEAVNGAWSGHSTVPIRGFGRVETVSLFPETFCNITGAPLAVPAIYAERRVADSRTVRYKGATRVEGDTNLHLQRFGFELLDLPGGVWEGTPWSWLVDYFWNVSEILDGMRLYFADVAWMNRTVRNVQTINVYRYHSPIAGVTVQTTGKPYYAFAAAVSRRALSEMPYPRFHSKIPGLTSLRWLNVASVAQQFSSLDGALKRLHI